MTHGTITNIESGQTLTGTKQGDPYGGAQWFDFKIDGVKTSNSFLVGEWTFEPDRIKAPTKKGIWLLYSYGLDEDGDLSHFPNLLLHLTTGWFEIGNYDAPRRALTDKQAEAIWNQPGRPAPVPLTLKGE